jgi:type VI secretion system secreted protein Hcp
MAVDNFLKIATVKGESKDKDHKDEIDVESWSFGVTNSGTRGGGSGGAGGGRANLHDFTFSMRHCAASPALFALCTSGTHVDDAVLTCRKAGGKKPVDFLKATMKKVFVSGFQTGGQGGSDITPTEQISLNFASITFANTAQNDDGSAGATIEKSYDVETHEST